MSSWKALAWAKDQQAGSPLAKLVLLLIAERCDEKYSCYPGRELLAKESEASWRGVVNAVRQLEARGLITTVAQKRPNGSQTSNRYYVNHPDAPHVQGVNGALDDAQGGCTQFTGGVHSVHGGGALSAPHGGELSAPLEPTQENPPPEQAAAEELLAQMPAPWLLSAAQRRQLAPAVSQALAAGWTPQKLLEHLRAGHEGVRSPVAVLRSRLADLPDLPSRSPGRVSRPLPAWCGQCDGPSLAERWRMVEARGTHPTFTRCPTCHPDARSRA